MGVGLLGDAQIWWRSTGGARHNFGVRPGWRLLGPRGSEGGIENLKSDGFVLETATILCSYMPLGLETLVGPGMKP